MTSPTQRTLAECRRRNWEAAVAEYWQTIPRHPGGGVRKDLFGFIDVVALDTSEGVTLAIQATSGTNVSARVRKIREECSDQARAWLLCGNRIVVWGWKKYAKRVDGKWWRVRECEVTLEDLETY